MKINKHLQWFNFHMILHAFQYATIKIIIFCPYKNLLNNKKDWNDTKIVVLKGDKILLLEGNPPQSWPWKRNGTIFVASAMILKVVNNWKSMLHINILKKS